MRYIFVLIGLFTLILFGCGHSDHYASARGYDDRYYNDRNYNNYNYPNARPGYYPYHDPDRDEEDFKAWKKAQKHDHDDYN